ncbi:MAG: hypothetical protein ACR2H3_17225 [Acidimicrobiales bacterium]
MPARRQPRIAWPLIVLAAIAVAAGGATAISNIGGGSDGSAVDETSEPIAIERFGSVPSPVAEAIEPGPVPTEGWRVRYRVESAGTAPHLEDVVVRPPFDARIEVRASLDPTSALTSERELSLGVLATQNPGASPAVLEPDPTPAGIRIEAILADAVRLGLAEQREIRLVAGRLCHVYRTGGALDATVLAPVSDDADYVDLCVDVEGLLLEEWQIFDGHGIRQRVALEVDAPSASTDSELRRIDTTDRVAPKDGGGSLREVDPASRPQGRFFESPAPPAGFTFVGRYGAVPPQPGFADPNRRGTIYASTVDVFVRGADAIVVEVGGTLNLSTAFDLDPANPQIDLGGDLGTADVILGTSGAELRALVGDSGRFVKVKGTVPVADLEAVMRSLRPTEAGTGLVFID